MNVRIARLAIVALLVVSAVGGVVVAQSDSDSTAPVRPGNVTETQEEYDRSDLIRGGESPNQKYQSLRILDEMSAVWVVRYPPGVTSSYGQKKSQKFLESGGAVQRDRIRFVASHPWDGEQRDYTLNVVYWTSDTRTTQTENGTSEEQYANVTAVERHKLTFDAGMQKTQDIALRTHSDSTVRVTMWFESNPDIRWTFQHHSVPTAEPLSISSEGAFWSTVFMRFGWIILLGVPVSAYSARSVLDKTIVGPQKGLGWWLIVGGVTLGAVALFAWWQATTLLVRLPQLAGVLIAAITFVVFLEGFDSNIRSVLFERSILDEARSPEGDEVRDERYREISTKRVVETDDGHLAIVSKGWRPFFARWFANPAKIPIEDIKTQVDVKGPYEKAFVADPESERTIEHRPPTLVWDPQLIDAVDAEAETPRPLSDRLNTRFLLAAIGGPALGYTVMNATLGLPYVGVAVGLLPALVLGVSARDGHATFDPAPIHQTQAKATLAWEQQHYADSSLNEDLREIAWLERLKNPLRGKVLRTQFEETITSRMNKQELGEEAGVEGILADLEDDLEGYETDDSDDEDNPEDILSEFSQEGVHGDD